MEITFPPVDPGEMRRAGGEAPRERIVRAIAGWIASRTLEPGARLPPVREAALQFHVDKGTMARAYRLLVERSIVQRSGRATRAILSVPGAAPAGRAPSRTLAIVTSYRGEELGSGPGAGGRSVAMLGGLLAAAHDGGWSVLFQHPEALAADGGAPPAAVIVTTALPGADAMIDRMLAAGVPVAVYGDVIARSDVDRVVSDHAAGVAALVAHLVGEGRTRIAIQMPPSGLPWVQARLAGYRAGLAAAGLPESAPLDFTVPHVDPRDEQQVRARVLGIAGELVEAMTGPTPPDAILTASDGHALVIGAAVRRFHRRVHEDVAVCGYDNYWAASPELALGLPAPHLTVDKGNERIGRALVALVAERIAGTLPRAPQVRAVAPELITVS